MLDAPGEFGAAEGMQFFRIIDEQADRMSRLTDQYYRNTACFVARKGSGFDPAAATGRITGAARATRTPSFYSD